MVPCPDEHPSSTSHRTDFQFFSADSLVPCNSDDHEAKLLRRIECTRRETRLSVEQDELKHHCVATLQQQTSVSGIVLCSTKVPSAQSCFARTNIHNGQRTLQHRSKHCDFMVPWDVRSPANWHLSGSAPVFSSSSPGRVSLTVTTMHS